MAEIPEDVMKWARDIAYLCGHLLTEERSAIIARALMAERAAERDRCARYHDSEIEGLEQQIAKNNAYMKREGITSHGANDFCRNLISSHRISATAIRGGTNDQA